MVRRRTAFKMCGPLRSGWALLLLLVLAKHVIKEVELRKRCG
jgi:hypothetical protein